MDIQIHGGKRLGEKTLRRSAKNELHETMRTQSNRTSQAMVS
jgi:hypothetical protein